tara:strand:+ start:295 stop:483 length:189 start_codon:yes stop_codon:yes gene_type:complete
MTTLFDFGMVHAEPDIWEVVPDIEWEKTAISGDALVWIYGTCWLDTSLRWWITPDHLRMVVE